MSFIIFLCLLNRWVMQVTELLKKDRYVIDSSWSIRFFKRYPLSRAQVSTLHRYMILAFVHDGKKKERKLNDQYTPMWCCVVYDLRIFEQVAFLRYLKWDIERFEKFWGATYNTYKIRNYTGTYYAKWERIAFLKIRSKINFKWFDEKRD